MTTLQQCYEAAQKKEEVPEEMHIELDAAKNAREDLSRWNYTGIICHLGDTYSYLYRQWQKLSNTPLGTSQDAEWLVNYTKECQELNRAIGEEKQRYYYGRK